MHLDLSVSKGQKNPNWAKWEDLITSKSNLTQPIELVTIRNLCRTLSLPTLDLVHKYVREAAKNKSRQRINVTRCSHAWSLWGSNANEHIRYLEQSPQTMSSVPRSNRANTLRKPPPPPPRRTVSELGVGIKHNTQIFSLQVNLDRMHTSFLNIYSK